MRMRPLIYLLFACTVAQAAPSAAADLAKDVRALQKTVDTLQRQLDREKRKSADAQLLEQRFEKRIADLEKTGGQFGKSPIPLESRLKALQTQVSQIDARLRALEQAAGGVSGGGVASLSSLDSRLDALESRIQISGSTLRLTAGTIELDAAGQINASGGSANMSFGTATFTGVLKSNSLITESVNSKSYTPGAGNVW